MADRAAELCFECHLDPNWLVYVSIIGSGVVRVPLSAPRMGGGVQLCLIEPTTN